MFAGQKRETLIFFLFYIVKFTDKALTKTLEASQLLFNYAEYWVHSYSSAVGRQKLLLVKLTTVPLACRWYMYQWFLSMVSFSADDLECGNHW